MTVNCKTKKCRKPTSEELAEMIESHQLWVESCGEQGEVADLRGIDLSCYVWVNLSEADQLAADEDSAGITLKEESACKKKLLTKLADFVASLPWLLPLIFVVHLGSMLAGFYLTS
jgi:hypothetical protein